MGNEAADLWRTGDETRFDKEKALVPEFFALGEG
jgi:hypothetical protein